MKHGSNKYIKYLNNIHYQRKKHLINIKKLLKKYCSYDLEAKSLDGIQQIMADKKKDCVGLIYIMAANPAGL